MAVALVILGILALAWVVLALRRFGRMHRDDRESGASIVPPYGLPKPDPPQWPDLSTPAPPEPSKTNGGRYEPPDAGESHYW